MIEDMDVPVQEVQGMLRGGSVDIAEFDIDRQLATDLCERGREGEYTNDVETFFYSYTFVPSAASILLGALSGAFLKYGGSIYGIDLRESTEFTISIHDVTCHFTLPYVGHLNYDHLSNLVKIISLTGLFTITGISMSKDVEGNQCIDTSTHISVAQWLLGATPIMFMTVEATLAPYCANWSVRGWINR